jgi:hypothetical protein
MLSTKQSLKGRNRNEQADANCGSRGTVLHLPCGDWALRSDTRYRTTVTWVRGNHAAYAVV